MGGESRQRASEKYNLLESRHLRVRHQTAVAPPHPGQNRGSSLGSNSLCTRRYLNLDEIECIITAFCTRLKTNLAVAAVIKQLR